MEQINLFGYKQSEKKKPISQNCVRGSKIFTTLGASNHTDKERDLNDYYATSPIAAKLLMDVETFKPTIWECACGEGHLANMFLDAGYSVLATDLVDRGYGQGGIDFLRTNMDCMDMDIVTNPPYKYASAFAEHAMDMLLDGGKLALFLKLTFLESKERRKLFEKYPFRTLYVSSSRIQCAKNGDFESYGESAVAYGWYVWEKGFHGDPVIKWIN